MKPFLKKYIELIAPEFLILISKMPASILGVTDFLKFDGINGGFIGDYLGIPTIEIEGMKSMIKEIDTYFLPGKFSNIFGMLVFKTSSDLIFLDGFL